MKFLRFSLLMLLALFAVNVVCAQEVKEVTLTVSSDGTTKEEAVKLALRSAIEQAYGTFVSANTSILNDELVKDEIVTVSSGNIKNYKEIVSETLPDGRFFVTLRATVSLSKLISYAQSKGAECEFAGATFAMQMKLEELNRENISKVFDNLALQYKEIIPSCFDYEIKVEPSEDAERSYLSKFTGTYASDKMKKMAKNMSDSCVCISMVVTVKLNDNFKLIKQLVEQTFQGISVPNGENERYMLLGIDKAYYVDKDGLVYPGNDRRLTRITEKFRFPKEALSKSRFDLESLVSLLNTYYTEAKRSFSIVVNDKDTLNCVDWFTDPDIYRRYLEEYKNSGQYKGRYNEAIQKDAYWKKVSYERGMYREGPGLYEMPSMQYPYEIPKAISPYPYVYLDVKEGLVGQDYKQTYYEGEWRIYLMYPKADIAKLRSFKVVSGNVKF